MSVSIARTASIVNCSDREYFDLPQVSNSDINWVKENTSSKDAIGNKEDVYRFGSLLDAVVTESERINFFKKTLDDQPVDLAEWNKSIRMRKSFFRDKFCLNVYANSKSQVVMTNDVTLEIEGVQFTMPMRCKWDFLDETVPWQWGADLKSTAAISQEQFDAALTHFGYDQQMVLYMTIAGIKQVIVLGVSKVNYKVFRKVIREGDELYKSGVNKLKYWGWKYYNLFF